MNVTTSNDILKITNLSKIYGELEPRTQALKNLNLTIKAQSFTSIIGKSGSGKSTLLDIIGGLNRPTSGEVQLCGQNLFQMKDHVRTAFRRKHIGYVFQFFNLVPELTVYENICLPSYLDHHAPDYDFIFQIMEKLGLESKKECFAATLSGGEQQRTAVARALSIKPAILLADEPTGNLDRKSGEELCDLLHFSHQYFKQTILLVTHDLDLARTAERIITLEDGTIISDTENPAKRKGGDQL
ncbi:MAG: ABC transporter ATP-binding protein [Lachnospiraceae bacterium]|nr:ABC transporter ATP-binding protein [Lachnospiraceae bacterium]